MPAPLLPTPIRSWDDWFAAADASGMTGDAWLSHWWEQVLPDLARRRIRWQGPTEVPERAWDVARWGDTPRRTHGLINWDRHPPRTWREALAWGLMAYEPRDAALRNARSFPPVAHPMAAPNRQARQWYRMGLRFSRDDATFWLERMLESGNRFEDRPCVGGCSDVSWTFQMARVESPLRAAIEIGRVGLDGVNDQAHRWWDLFQKTGRPIRGGFQNAPYVLAYLLRQGFVGAEVWRQQLRAGTSTWDFVDERVFQAVAVGAPLTTLAQPWGPDDPDSGAPAWTFAHACTGHFQREVQQHEVLFPVDIWWFVLNTLRQRNAPLFHAARCPRDGALVTPWEEARRQAEDPDGFNHRALFPSPGHFLGVHHQTPSPEVRQAVLDNLARLREQEAQALLRVILDEHVGPLPKAAPRPRL